MARNRQPHPELNFGRGRGMRTRAKDIVALAKYLKLTLEETREIFGPKSDHPTTEKEGESDA